MTTKPALRLRRLIADETKGAITLNRLAQLINEANLEAGTNCFVNRKTLAKIRDEPRQVRTRFTTSAELAEDQRKSRL